MKYRVVVFGSSTFGLPAFQAIADHPSFAVVGVVTQPDRAQGRSAFLQPTPVSAWALNQHLPLLRLATLKEPAAQAVLATWSVDLYLVAAYGLILPAAVLAQPLRGSVNIHGSLLPAYRGASPITAALIDGQTQTGISYMVMAAGVDTGPVFSQSSLAIQADETKPHLEQRLSVLAGRTVVAAITSWLTGELSARAQDEQHASYAPRIDKQAGHATWDSAITWERKIRAFTPWPGVWALWRGQIVKILAARVESSDPKNAPGSIISQGSTWGIACEHGVVIPTRVQFAGRQPQPADRIPGSYPGFIGSRFD